MAKVAHITDLHLTEKHLDGPDGHARIFGDAVKGILSSGAVLCTVGGDLSGYTVPHRATIRERNLLVDGVAEIARVMPVVFARGNHDSPGDWSFLNVVRQKHPVTYSEEPELILTKSAAVMVLPWLDQTRFSATDDYSEAVTEAYRKAIISFQDDLRQARKEGLVSVLLVHGAFNATMFRDGQPAVPTADPMLNMDDLADPRLFDVAFAGHYHYHQRIPAKVPSCYGGSLSIHQFGEDYPKGWTLFDTETGEFEHRAVAQRLKVKLVLDPKTSRIVDCQPEIEGLKSLPVGKLKKALAGQSSLLSGCDVRIVYEASGEDILGAAGTARAVLDELEAVGAVVETKAKIERTQQLREGMAEVAHATTLSAKVRHWTTAAKLPATKATVEGAIVRLNHMERALEETK